MHSHTPKLLAASLALGCGSARPAGEARVLPLASATSQPSARPVEPPPEVSDGVIVASDVVERATNPSKLPVYDGPTGIVDGTVLARGNAAPYAVVGVTGYSGFVIREERADVRVIEEKAFDPKVIVLTFGQALLVQNETPNVRHPAFEQQPHEVALLPGATIRLHPKAVGRYRLVDGSRSADVYVAATPLHATTDANGHFEIARVPVGKITVHAYTDRETAAEVDVHENAVTSVKLSVP